MQADATGKKGSGELIATVRRACAELIEAALGSGAAGEEATVPHRLADAAVAAAKLGCMPDEDLERRILAVPKPRRLGTELFSEVRLRGKTVCFRISDGFLIKAAAERAKTLPEPVLPEEIAIPASGAAPDEGARAYALSLAICAHRCGRPFDAERAHEALLRCLLLADAPKDRAALVAAVRAVLAAFQNGLFGGEPALFMAKVLSCCGN